MYGVIEVAGHQYRVKAGDIIDVEKLSSNEGDVVEIDKVLFVGGDNPQVGLPVVEGALVKAKVIRQAKGKKVLVFKRKPGMYQKKQGHRQEYTGLLITEIKDGKGASSLIDSSSKEAKKYLK